jgi:phosphoribosylglycinamide formyltransferase-1
MTRMSANASGSDPSSSPDTRVAVLSSNVGGHVQALLEDPVVGRWIALVVAERPDAFALRHAEWHGVPAVALHAGKSYLDLYDVALVRLLEEHSIDYVVVAGFLRIVGSETVHAYEHRIVKVHHSLLPEFPGPDPVADALGRGVKETGVTVHLINRELEAGPIVSQQALEVREGEDWHSLTQRLHQLEMQLLPAAVRTLVETRRPSPRS